MANTIDRWRHVPHGFGADRLLCDDGRTLPWRPTAGKAQRDRRVEGWARYRSACRIAYEARRSWERFEFL